jgi:hypothetical protein
MTPKEPISLDLELPENFTIDDMRKALQAAINDEFVNRLHNEHVQFETVQMSTNKRFQSPGGRIRRR